MMSLLSVTVKKARFVGAQAAQFNTYVTLKLQNVKSTTVTVKGPTPCWEQDFLFETNDLNTGLLIEVWSKGMIWDRAMGYHWIPLQTVQYSNDEGNGQWVSLDGELLMNDGEVIGTKIATGHSLLVDCRFELPFDPENIEAGDLQRKLEMLNNIMDKDARAEQARRQMQYIGHSGYSEDSDYTSDLNYPVGQHANSSASQFRSAAHQIHTPQRSLETSRENSYERDDGQPGHGYHQLPVLPVHQQHLSPGSYRRHHQRNSPNNPEDFGYNGGGTSIPTGQNPRQCQDNNLDSDPLFYNSRPRNMPDFSSRRRNYAWESKQQSQEAWMSCESSYNQSMDSVDADYPVTESDYYGNHPPTRRNTSSRATRRPSLERQTTLYDDSTYYGDSTSYYTNPDVTQVNFVASRTYNSNQSGDEFYDSLPYPFQEERYGQDEEDRQWDSGGMYLTVVPPPSKTSKKLPAIPVKRRSSITMLEQDGYPYSSTATLEGMVTPTNKRKMPQIPTKRSASRQSSIHDQMDGDCGYRTPDIVGHRGASLPPTPTKVTKVIMTRMGNQGKGFNSLPPTPGRQLPKPNMNHRSAKMTMGQKRGLMMMTRTSSADCEGLYTEDAASGVELEGFGRSGAVSAREVYNEDYNYAYQSNDNLPVQPVELVDNFAKSNQPVSVPNEEYFYENNYERSDYQEDSYFGDSVSQRRMPLNQQKVRDSFESREDDFKDCSFETALSSVNNSMHQIKGYVPATVEPSVSVASSLPSSVPSSMPSSTANTVTAAANVASAVSQKISSFLFDSFQKAAAPSAPKPQPTQYQGDHLSKAIPATLTTTQTIPSVTVAQVHNQQTTLKSNINHRGFLEQQASIDSSYDVHNLKELEAEEAEMDDIFNHYHLDHAHPDEYHLQKQDSVESYTEEEEEPIHPTEYTKAAITTINRDSPHSANYEDDTSLRRGSSQITVVLDPYHPQAQSTTPRPIAPTRRPSETYQAYDEFLTTSRKNSLVDTQQRRASITYNQDIPEEEQEQEFVDEEPIVPLEKKSVSFEEELEDQQVHQEEEVEAVHRDMHKLPPQDQVRPQITAKQRWLWAYNKIIMQLNMESSTYSDYEAKTIQILCKVMMATFTL